MTGVQMATDIKKLNPDIPMILMTGYTDAIKEKHALGELFKATLNKPLRSYMLAATVRSILDDKELKF